MDGSNTIEKICWEMDGAGGFDDIVLLFIQPQLDKSTGNNYTREYYQIKFHVNHSKAFSCDALADSSFIGNKSESLLQRVQNLRKSLGNHKDDALFFVVNTWGLDSNDRIGEILDSDGTIILDKLLNPGPKSKLGKVREKWRTHLGLKTDEELKEVLSPLRIVHSYSGFNSIDDTLNDRLRSAGLIPISAQERTNPYEQLIQKLHAEGKNEFTKQELFEVCKQEGLVAPPPSTGIHAVGIRSFVKGAENLEEEVDDVLCLLEHFDNRRLVDGVTWEGHIYPCLCDFADSTLAQQKPIQVHIDSHLVLAFTLGYCLDPKYGADVSVVQKTRNGKILWQPNTDELEYDKPQWSWNEHVIESENLATDIALAVSVTQDVFQDVEYYVSENLNSVRKIIEVSILPEPTNTSVKDGTHALNLAQRLISGVKKRRTISDRRGTIHLFMAAPAAAVLFMGQHAKTLGRIKIYEYDFSGSEPGAYTPALNFPIS
ncbi:SAVED domain-containing protein [Tunicatimonas pelagia]|uniref:SAVED domain-containing protein n=1 Tax=Tunicatimonas pelagia TaxID=931531 RepID=UPI0026665DE1|nr:SAVED domain-containing protein [Tunicatimonas pelagia]WKN44909.1 SAVED domain-containing protein [Tunicatimonas pelagia]